VTFSIPNFWLVHFKISQALNVGPDVPVELRTRVWGTDNPYLIQEYRKEQADKGFAWGADNSYQLQQWNPATR
jgi:hypothetical protein